MASTITPNMGLIVPTVGQEPGPTWGTDLNSSLGTLDQHNHSSGQGVQITPNGINVNIDLPINGNNLTSVKTVNFTAQSSSLAGLTPNLGCVYVAGNELYYNDEAGNVVQITNVGSVNAGAGSITGLPSGTASASYSSGSGTFIWQSATSTSANMDNGSVIIREQVASAKGVKLSSPASLAADYELFFPAALPGGPSFVTLDASGNIGDSVSYPLTGGDIASNTITNTNIADNSISGAKLTDASVSVTKLSAKPFINTTAGIGQVAIASSSGAFSTSTIVSAAVTNQTINITTAGRPVQISCQADSSTNGASFNVIGAINSISGLIELRRDFVLIYSYVIAPNQNAGESVSIPGCISFLDPVPAGTYQYQLRVAVNNPANTITVTNIQTLAYEI